MKTSRTETISLGIKIDTECRSEWLHLTNAAVKIQNKTEEEAVPHVLDMCNN